MQKRIMGPRVWEQGSGAQVKIKVKMIGSPAQREQKDTGWHLAHLLKSGAEFGSYYRDWHIGPSYILQYMTILLMFFTK